MSVYNLGEGGGGSKGVRDVFQGGVSGDTNFWVGDVGDDPLHGLVPGGVPTQGISTDHWEAALGVIGRDLVISTSGDGDTGSGFLIDGCICAEGAECDCLIHFDATDSVHLQGNVADPRDLVHKNVVGAGGTGPDRSEGDGGGSRRGRWAGISGGVGGRVAGN